MTQGNQNIELNEQCKILQMSTLSGVRNVMDTNNVSYRGVLNFKQTAFSYNQPRGGSEKKPPNLNT
jgi:hypothetical protein